VLLQFSEHTSSQALFGLGVDLLALCVASSVVVVIADFLLHLNQNVKVVFGLACLLIIWLTPSFKTIHDVAFKGFSDTAYLIAMQLPTG